MFGVILDNIEDFVQVLALTERLERVELGMVQ